MEVLIMDGSDIIIFVLWSAGLYGIADLNGWWLLGCQGAWLALFWAARKIIDRVVDVRFERREAE
jgi:hypothetical protein